MGDLWVEEIRVYGANRRYTPVIFVLWDEKTIIFEKNGCIWGIFSIYPQIVWIDGCMVWNLCVHP